MPPPQTIPPSLFAPLFSSLQGDDPKGGKGGQKPVFISFGGTVTKFQLSFKIQLGEYLCGRDDS